MTKKHKMEQSGNALWFILIAIGLLGLLTVSLTRSGSNTNETGSFEQNQIAVSQILTYAKSIENAVQSLLSRGCSENEISFDNNIVTGYENLNAPDDNSCHVFEPEGAGMSIEYESALYTSALSITDVYSSRSELLFILENMGNNQCQQINRITGAPVIDEAYTTPTQFTGGFTASGFIGDADETEESQSGCFESTSDSQNHFYHVLHAR